MLKLDRVKTDLKLTGDIYSFHNNIDLFFLQILFSAETLVYGFLYHSKNEMEGKSEKSANYNILQTISGGQSWL